VRYWSDSVSEAFLASTEDRNENGDYLRCRSDVSITLPVPAPQGKELEDLIMTHAPKHWLKTLEDVANPNVDTSLSHIKEMVGKPFRKEVDLQPENFNSQVLSDDEIRKLIEKFSTDKNA
jgi:hypothetical protein